MDRIAVVTGGASGIGRHLVTALAATGYHVAYTHLPGETATVTGATGFPCDAGDAGAVADLYPTIQGHFGGAPNLIVNNAGIQTWAPLLDLDVADWDAVLRTNLRGAFLNIQAGARAMVDHAIKGVIINIGSGCNKLAFPNLVDYTASKGGIEQLTKSAAIELGCHGIRVNCVAPGAVETDRTRAEADGYAEKWAALTPLGRVGHPQDIANAVLFLASDQAGFITGQTLGVDGGVFSRPAWPDYP